MVQKVFAKYDTDRSGFLEKREVLKLLDDILLSQGRQKTTWTQFNNFFEQFDSNGDGVISMSECARFVRSFMDMPMRRPAIEYSASRFDSPTRIRRSISPTRHFSYTGDEYSLMIEKDSEIDRLKSTVKFLQNKADAADEFKNNCMSLQERVDQLVIDNQFLKTDLQEAEAARQKFEMQYNSI